MKVAIIAFSNLKYSPYVRVYSNHLEKQGIPYDVILANRDGISETLGESLYAIEWDRKKSRFSNCLKFRREALHILKKNKYDFIFVLTTMPAVLLSGYLKRNYKGKYLLDVRDYTYENILPYFLMVKRVVKHSAMNVISSPGFRNFLPAAEYWMCHNVNLLYGDCGGKVHSHPSDGTITVGYVGSIAYKEQCLKFIQLVEKDPRFRFHLHGREGENRCISEYLEANPCERIKIFGAYQPEEKTAILESVDVLFNAYGNGNNLLDYALSNKLYDSLYMRIPLLTSPATSMSEEAGPFSFDIDFNKTDSLDALYDWYQSLDGQAFDQYAKDYLTKVAASQEDFYKKLSEIVHA